MCLMVILHQLPPELHSIVHNTCIHMKIKVRCFFDTDINANSIFTPRTITKNVIPQGTKPFCNIICHGVEQG